MKLSIVCVAVAALLPSVAQADYPLQDYLRITELNYHPYASTAAEQAAGFTDENDFEFVELRNIGAQTLDLTGVQFVEDPRGITFDFTGSNVTSLEPSAFVLTVNDLEAFEFRYPGVGNVAGEYLGKLNNAGEQITLNDAWGQPIFDFTYGDSGAPGWPDPPDGDGPSLELIDPAAVPPAEPGRTDFLQDPANWRSSIMHGGTPGSPIPEPSTLALLTTGAVGLLAYALRRRKRAA